MYMLMVAAVRSASELSWVWQDGVWPALCTDMRALEEGEADLFMLGL